MHIALQLSRKSFHHQMKVYHHLELFGANLELELYFCIEMEIGKSELKIMIGLESNE